MGGAVATKCQYFGGGHSDFEQHAFEIMSSLLIGGGCKTYFLKFWEDIIQFSPGFTDSNLISGHKSIKLFLI